MATQKSKTNTGTMKPVVEAAEEEE